MKTIKVGNSKWRVPSIQELLTLVIYNSDEPTSNYMVCKPVGYWTAEEFGSSELFAWYMYFSDWHLDYGHKTNKYLVKCVRDTPAGLEWANDSNTQLSWDDAFKYADKLNFLGVSKC